MGVHSKLTNSMPPNHNSSFSKGNSADGTQGTVYYCSKCHLTFVSTKKLEKHWKTSASHYLCKFHPCYHDNFKDYDSLEGLQQHYRERHYLCPFCNDLEDYQWCRGMQEHFINYHYVCGTLSILEQPCRNCKLRKCVEPRRLLQQSQAKRVEEHCQLCNQNFPDSVHLRCDLCALCFTTEAEQREHYTTSPKHKLTYCPECYVDFTDWENLQMHLIYHHKDTYCRYCHLHHRRLRYHNFDCHSDRYCDRCRKVFPSKEDFHLDCKDHDFYCDECDIVFPESVDTRSHNRESHKDSFCDTCQLRYRSPKQLREHNERRHPHLEPQKLEEKRLAEENRLFEEGFPDYYGILRATTESTHEEILEKVKPSRIDAHQYKDMREEGISAEYIKKRDEWARDFGQAVDILSDPASRKEYDRELRLWKSVTQWRRKIISTRPG